jgi:hypothetical protein
MTTAHMLANVLNRHLASPLRVEIVRAETTQATGQVNFTEVAHATASRLREIEQLPLDQLPQESIWDQDGLLFVWRARAKASAKWVSPSS